MIVTPDARGRDQSHSVIPLRALPMWLATIDVRKVAEAVREKLTAYQLEAADALHRHFFGNPSPPATTSLVAATAITLQNAQALHQLALEQEGMRTRLASAEARAEAAETKADAALAVTNLMPGYMSLLGYCNLHRLQLTVAQMSAEGRRLCAACRLSGTHVGEVPDQRYGTVKVYPLAVLDRWREERSRP